MSAYGCKYLQRYLPLLLCAASTCSASLARADDVAPPEKNQYAPVKVPIIGTAAADAPAIIDKLRSGELTAGEAWQSGELKLDDVLYLLGNYFDPWGGVEWQNADAVRLSLAELVVQHAPEKLKNPDELPLRVRLWVGDYLQSINDERAVALLESVLSEFKEAKADQDPAVFQAAQRLGNYYKSKGEWEKSAQAWSRVVPLHDDKDWRVSDAMIEAARMYAAAGNNDKAQELYARVPQVGKSWFTGMALYDRAYALIKQNQHSEARQLLQTPIAGEDGEVKVGLLSLLSASYLRTGEVAAAQRSAQQAIDAYVALDQPRADMGLQDQVKRAKKVLAWCKGYQARQNLNSVSKDNAAAPFKAVTLFLNQYVEQEQSYETVQTRPRTRRGHDAQSISAQAADPCVARGVERRIFHGCVGGMEHSPSRPAGSRTRRRHNSLCAEQRPAHRFGIPDGDGHAIAVSNSDAECMYGLLTKSGGEYENCNIQPVGACPDWILDVLRQC